MEQFDVAIVGGGPGGYVAAIRAATEGMSVALIEGKDLGGTCLNRGCIPSKTLLKHAELVDGIKHADSFGVHVTDYRISLDDMMNRKKAIIHQLKKGIETLLWTKQVTVLTGYGHIHADKTITVTMNEQSKTIKAKNIIIATGSTPSIPNIPGLDQIAYETSDTIFDITKLPAHLTIIGGGVIGVELATIFNSFNVKVEIIEMGGHILPHEDEAAASILHKQFIKRGISVHTNAKVTEVSESDGTISLEMETNSETKRIVTEKVLLAVGRTANNTGSRQLSLKYTGPFITVNQQMETSIPGIYAIGDVIGGYQLAHAASSEGLTVINHIVGKNVRQKVHIPRCVYTTPEIASIGLTEHEAEEAGYHVNVKSVPLTTNGKALAAGDHVGFMKIIADSQYGEILGVVMVGAHATEMISQATTMMNLEGTVEELEQIVFPHPTLSESLFEAASSMLNRAIHFID